MGTSVKVSSVNCLLILIKIFLFQIKILWNLPKNPIRKNLPTHFHGSTLTQRSIMNDPKGKSRLFLNDNKTDKTERKKSDKTEEEEKRVNENDIKKELEERGIIIEDWMLDDDDKPEKSGKKKKKGGKKSKGGKNDKNGATPTSSLTNIGDGSKSEGRTDGGKVKKDGKNNNAKRSGNTTNTDDTQSVHSSTATGKGFEFL